MEDQATSMRHAAEVQETKLNEMGRERDVLLKLRHKAEGASSAQVRLPGTPAHVEKLRASGPAAACP